MEVIELIQRLSNQEMYKSVLDLVEELVRNPEFKQGDADRTMDDSLFNEIAVMREKGLPKTVQERHQYERLLLIFEIAMFRNFILRRASENDLDDGFDF